jgi:Tfp pilus assembly protein PilV
MLRHRAKSQVRGFTIAEVMVAACVMALAITTSITTMQRAFLAIDTSRNLTVAGQIMVNEMEKIRMQSWSQVSDVTLMPRDTDTALTLDSIFSSNPQIGTRFTLSRRISQPDSANATILEIKFTVTWRGYDGRELSRSYTTHYAQYGIHDFLYNSS